MQFNNTLTAVERLGLVSECNMADGHAYHDLTEAQSKIIGSLPYLWKIAVKKDQHQAEFDFLSSFHQLAVSPSLSNYKDFVICPTASNSIDIVGACLNHLSLNIGLVEPTFDNLALLLRRRKVNITAIEEDVIFRGDLDGINADQFDALFLVNPNNPTGQLLSKERFIEIVNWCHLHNKLLILDCTFRFFVPQSYEQFKILLDSGISFITIEDTGKVWPTQDIKASLLIFSSDLASLIKTIYEEIYLCVSNFQLELLGQFMRDAHKQGLDNTLWSEVARRRQLFREALKETRLYIDPIATESKISVEWVRFNEKEDNDTLLLSSLQQQGLIALPGRLFYWNSSDNPSSQRHLRFSLLKLNIQFNASLQKLQQSFNRTYSELVHG